MDAVTVDVDVALSSYCFSYTPKFGLTKRVEKEFVYVGNGLCESLGPPNKKIDSLNFVK